MLEFEVATEAALAEDDGEEKVVEFTVAGKVFKARRPTPGQLNAIFATTGGSDGTRVVWQIFERILIDNDPETPRAQRHAEFRDLRDLVFDGVITPALLFGGDELNGSGILDGIIKEFAGRPTQPSEPSSPSPSPAGRRSTGRSPGKGSTRSASD